MRYYNKESKRIKVLENIAIERGHRWELIQQLMAMFKYGVLPFRVEFLEWELLRRGYVCAVKTEGGNVLIGSCTWDSLDEYGLPAKGAKIDFFTRWGGYQGTYTLGVDAVIGYNNKIRTPITNIDWYSNLYTNIDIAIEANVKHSMVSGIPVARSEKIKKALEDIIDDIRAGITKTIAGDKILQELKDGTTAPLEILHLTQPEQIERVQYLSKLYDDLNRRFWTRFGHSMNSTGKMAQVNEMEMEGYESYSMIIPDDMLESRKSFLEDVNKLFGTSYTVEYSDAWKHIEEEQKETEQAIESDTPNGEEDDRNGGQEVDDMG